MAQDFVGARYFPLLQAGGQFGSRSKGGGDHGSPRYICTRFNKNIANAIFPPSDDPTLEYVYEDGIQCEPRYYVPIVPMAILESYSVPATGWKSDIFARDFDSVVFNIRALINDTTLKEMPISTRGFKGEFRKVGKRLYCVGDYYHHTPSGKVVITELPMFVWTDKFVEGLEKKSYINSVKDNSSSTDVNIEIQFVPGGIAEIKKKFGNVCFDSFEEYLGLYSIFHDFLNMMGKNGSVMEFKTYEEILLCWFEERKSQYAKRIKREVEILKMRIAYYGNIVRFVSNYKRLKLPEMDDDEAEKLLVSEKYKKFNKSVVESPGFLPAEELMTRAMKSKNCTFNYLLDITTRDMFVKASVLREKKLKALEEELRAINDAKENFLGANVWLDELKKLEIVVEEGIRTEWKFGDLVEMDFEE
jgi:DNA topoisomerase-2